MPDKAGQQLTPVAGLSATTAAGLARRVSSQQWRSTQTGLATVSERVLVLLPAARRTRLTEAVTIDIDATDVEVYGRKKHGVAYNYAVQRCGRPHVATWAQTETVLAADLLTGDEEPRPGSGGLLRRALAALPAPARACEDIAVRVDAGYFAGELSRTARAEQVRFAIGAKRIAPLWRLLSGIAEHEWTDAIEMHGAQIAVAGYAPAD